MKPEKSGVKTSEFWMSLIAMALTTSGIGLSPDAVVGLVEFIPVIISSVYTLGRSIIKAFGG